MVGGLAFSQLVTLYVTPVFYTYFDEIQVWMRRGKAKEHEIDVAASDSETVPEPA